MASLRGVVLVSRALGLAPYSMVDSGDPFNPSTLLRVSSLAGVIVVGSVSVLLYHFARMDINRGYAVAETIATTMTALNVSVFCASLWRRQYPELWRILNSPDVRLVAARRQAWPVLPALAVVLSCVGGILMSMVFFYLNDGEYVWVRNSTLSLVLWIMISSGEVALFAFLLACVAERFGDLNAELQALMVQYRAAGGVAAVPLAVTVHRIRAKHKEVSDLLGRMSRCFGLQTLLELLLTLWWSVTLMFTTIVTRSSPTHKVPLVCLLGGYVFSKSWFVLFADRTVTKGNEVLSIVHEFLNATKLTDQETKELEAFARQVFQRPVLVSLAGIVELNTRLLFQAGAAAATYMIILLQFQSTSWSNNTAVTRPGNC